MEDQGNPDQSELDALQDSLRQAQLALQNNRAETDPDNSQRIHLSRQVDLLSHLVLMQAQED